MDGVGLRTALLRDTLAVIETVAASKAVLYTPADLESELRLLTPFGAVFLAQRGATLGARMRNGVNDLINVGFGPIVLVGADLPTLPSTFVQDAFERLADPADRLVLGPAKDGGYYLIGLKRMHKELFVGIPWGTADVLRSTRAAADALNLPVSLLPTWYDVDQVTDLDSMRQRDNGTRLARHTMAWLETALPGSIAASEGGENT
jgi:rSAM/selenodomain-associated transferase 1